jgi:hypothetical protein
MAERLLVVLYPGVADWKVGNQKTADEIDAFFVR